MRRLVGALIVGALALLYVGYTLLSMGYSVKSRYDFQHRPAEIVSGLPGSRLIGSTKDFRSGLPLTLFWPEVAWTFAMPDPVLSGRFFTFRWEYGEDQATGIYLVDADCEEKKLTWYDPGDPDTAFPARDLYGEPVTDPAGDTYRRSAAQPDPPPRWMHEFCDTDWTTERKAAAGQ